MREAPCISTDQSEIQEATTNHKGPGEFIIAGSLQKIKEERLTLITFPTTTESFIAFQEASTGRTLDTWEKDFSVELTELANLAFDDGKAGRERFDILAHSEDYFTSNSHADLLQEPGVQHILKMMDLWSRTAYHAGKEAAQHEADRSAQED